MRNSSLIVGCLLGVFVCFWPLDSQANVGVPVFLNYVFYAWILLIPIMGIEAYVIGKRLNISAGRAIGVSVAANFASTILGSVVVVIVSFLLALQGLQDYSVAMSDVSILVALIPCFFLSVWFETIVGFPFLKRFSREQVRGVFFLANQFSYALLAIVPIARLIKNAIVSGTSMWY